MPEGSGAVMLPWPSRSPPRAVPAPVRRAIPEWCLFLDVDGTLLEFAPLPNTVLIPAGLRLRIQALQQALGGALALISGRTLQSLDLLFAPVRVPAIGNHGLERRDAAGRLFGEKEREPRLTAIRQEMQAFAYAHHGLYLEDKGSALALHFGRAPQFAAQVRGHAAAMARRLGHPFQVLDGNMVCEIRSAKPDKAAAIEAFLGEWPFAGRKPIFIGDDESDIVGFTVIKRYGGLTIAVGEGLSADVQLANPRAVNHWLTHFLARGEPWR